MAETMDLQTGDRKRRGSRMKDAKKVMEAWKQKHPRITCVLIASFSFVALFGLFAYLIFSGFGSSADFIYNQF